MNDLGSVEFGLIGLALMIIYKLVDRMPYFQKKSDTTLNETIATGLSELITMLKSDAFAMSEEAKTQTALLVAADNSHHSEYARRKNGTFLWVNDPEREKQITETHKDVKEIKRLLHKTND